MVATKVFIQIHSSSFSHGPTHFFFYVNKNVHTAETYPGETKPMSTQNVWRNLEILCWKKQLVIYNVAFGVFFFFFFFFFFYLGFMAISRIFHLYQADRSSKMGENQRTRGKTTWPSVSRTWLTHMWPQRGWNHSGEKPNGLGVNSPIH